MVADVMFQSPSGKQSTSPGGDHTGKSLRSLVAGLEQLRDLAESLVEHHEQGQLLPVPADVEVPLSQHPKGAGEVDHQSHGDASSTDTDNSFAIAASSVSPLTSAADNSFAIAAPSASPLTFAGDDLRTPQFASHSKHQVLGSPLPPPKAMVAGLSWGLECHMSYPGIDDEPCWPDKEQYMVSFAGSDGEDSGPPMNERSSFLSEMSNGKTSSPDGKQREKGKTVGFAIGNLRVSASAIGDSVSTEVLEKEAPDPRQSTLSLSKSNSVMCSGNSLKPARVSRASRASARPSVISQPEQYVEDQTVQVTLRQVWIDALQEKGGAQNRTLVKGQLADKVTFIVEVLDSPDRKLLCANTARRQRFVSQRLKRFSQGAKVQKVQTTKRRTTVKMHDVSKDPNKLCNICILHPFGWFVMVWCAISVLLVFFDLMTIPMEVFPLPRHAVWIMDKINLASAVFWLLDILVNFRTAVMMGVSVEYRPRLIATHYLKTWFPMDLFIVCCEWLGRLVNSRSWSLVFKALKAPKILRLAKLPHLCKMIEEKLSCSMKSMRLLLVMVKMTIALCFSIHLACCGWYWMGSVYKDGWITYLNIPPCGTFRMSVLEREEIAENEPDYADDIIRTMTLYFTSCRWVLAQVNGRTDQDARRNIVEMVYTCICAVLGPLLAMSVFVSFITSTMMELSAMAQENRERRQLVDQYVAMHRIHPELSALLKQHVRNKDDFSKHVDMENQLLDMLPKQLRKDVLYEVRSPVLGAHHLFHVLNSHFPSAIRDVCIHALIHVVVKQGEKIFEKGDACTRMLFTYRGSFMYSQAKPLGKRKPGIVMQHSEDPGGPADTPASRVSRAGGISTGVWVSECALWLEWQNHGQLNGHSDGCLYSIEAYALAETLRTYKDILPMAAKYARAFREALEEHGHLSDVLDLTVENEMGGDQTPVATPSSQVRAWRSVYV